MHDVAVRLAASDDLPAILEISNWAALNTPANFAIEPEPLDQWRQVWRDTHEMFPWLVAELESKRASTPIVGFAKASPWLGRCAYAFAAEVTVYVAPENHGKRIGHALYARLIELLDTQGYRTLIGGISLPNPASVRLHESFGFQRAALFEQIGWKFDRWHDVGYWQRPPNAEGAKPSTIKPVAQAMTNVAAQR